MPQQPLSKTKQAKETRSKSRAGAGGPKTVEGKNAARFNALKHGCKTGQLVVLLADETAEDLEKLRAGWLEEFDPETFAEKKLVDELIRAHWLFQRAQRRLMETERAIAGDDNAHPVDWPAEDEHKVELLQRYKTSHERSYYRALSVVRQYWKDQLDEAMKKRTLERENDELQRENRELRARERELQQELARFEEPGAREREGATEGPRDAAGRTREGETQLVQRVFQVRRAHETGRLVRLEEWGG